MRLSRRTLLGGLISSVASLRIPTSSTPQLASPLFSFLITMPAEGLQGSTADRYREFVRAVLPLTRELAKRDAQIRETKVFVDRASELQAALSRATDRCSVMARLIQGVNEVTGSMTTQQLLEQLVLTQQLLNLSDDVLTSTQSYLSIANGVDVDRSFEDYDVARVYIDLPQPKVEALDGAYVESGNPIKALILFAKSVWQFVTNQSEQDQIDEDAARLARERCTSAEYRTFATEYSMNLVRTFKDTRLVFDNLAEPISAFQEQWANALKAHATNIQTRLEQLATDVVASAQEEARVRTRQLLAPISEQVERRNLSARANLRLARLRRDLNSAGCNNVSARISEIEADLALAKVLGLTTTLRLEPLIRKDIVRRLNECGVRKKRNHIHLGRRGHSSPTFMLSAGHAPELTAVNQDRFVCVEISNGAVSFCDVLRGLGGAGGASSNNGVGVCYSSATLNYSMCGADSMGGVPGGTDAWKDGRAIVAALQTLPGKYNERRGEQTGYILDVSLQLLRQRANDLKQVVQDFETAASTYRTDLLTPAVNQTVASIGDMQRTAAARLASISTPPDVRPIPRPPAAQLVSGALREQIEQVNLTDDTVREKWNAVEPLWDIYQYRLGELSPPDRAAVLEIIDKHIDRNGIVNTTVVGEDVGRSASILGGSLQTSASEPTGRLIRKQLNRGLVGYSSGTNESARASAAGAIGLAVAADGAGQRGDTASEHSLLQLAKSSADVGLGLIPVVSSVNDAVQLVYGLATGYDYTGHKMEASDFALRGFGVVVGLIPVAGLRVGAVAVGKELLAGASLIRELSIGRYVRELGGEARLVSVHITESVGEWFSKGVRNLISPEELAMRTAGLVRAEGELTQKIPRMVQGGAIEDFVLGAIASPKNSERILVGTATDAAFRIPDVINRTRGFVGEIKSSRRLDLPGQLADYLRFVQNETPPLKFRLYVLPDTVLTDRLKAAIVGSGSQIFDVTPNGILPRILN